MGHKVAILPVKKHPNPARVRASASIARALEVSDVHTLLANRPMPCDRFDNGKDAILATTRLFWRTFTIPSDLQKERAKKMERKAYGADCHRRMIARSTKY
jgi:hypothetical protein